MVSNITGDFSHKSTELKCQLERLPTEISAEIYRHLMISEWGLIHISLVPSETIFDKEELVPIHASILRTSRRIYQEASAILYNENHFAFYLSEMEGFDAEEYIPYGFPLNNFRLVRFLDIGFDVELDGLCSIEGICRFLNTLTALECSFKQLKFLYRFSKSVTKEMDYLTKGFCQDLELLDATCAIDVQRGIKLRFSSRDAVPEITALYDRYAQRIADRKFWIIEESCRGLWSRPEAENCTKISKCWILHRPSSIENRVGRLSLQDSDVIL